MTSLLKAIIDDSNIKLSDSLDKLKPIIELRAGICLDYLHLLRGEHNKEIGPKGLLLLAQTNGRIIVCGRGASGKSTILRRTALRAGGLGHAPFFADLSRWDPEATLEWPACRANPRDAFDFLLQRFGLSSRGIADAELLDPSLQKFFFIDGLNETPGSTADEILSACDGVASLVVGASVIVSDRLVRRNLEKEVRWRFVMPLPVAETEVIRLTTGVDLPVNTRALLSLPFFLDRAIHGELRNSPLSTIKELIVDKGKLAKETLPKVAAASYEAYEIDGSRSFSRARFDERGISEIAQSLIVGGILVRLDETLVAFQHHWFHDYLASVHVATNEDLWSVEKCHHTLDVLTFKANSFDAVSFVLELTRGDASGRFLRAVFDWNPYAAGYALASANVAPDDVPHDVRIIVLAMLADKKFDRHFYTAQRAKDALALLQDDEAVRFRDIPTREALLETVKELPPAGPEFERWRSFFTQAGLAVSEELTGALYEEDSIVGWTAANVIKRLELPKSLVPQIVRASRDSRAVVRWRAVHAMGGFPRRPFVFALFDRLANDSNENVKYGAMRSLVEIASFDAKFTTLIVDETIKRIGLVSKSKAVVGELSRSTFLTEHFQPPSNWVSEMSRLFYALADRADDSAEAERWWKLASTLRMSHPARERQVA
jgi:hypothetical protein